MKNGFFLKEMNKRLLGVTLIFLVGLGALAYVYLNPAEKALLSVASTSFPAITYNNKPDHLSITFENTADTHNKHYKEEINAPIATIDDVGKEVTKGVALSPAISGTWKWTNQEQLTFIPKQDWPADQEFVIRMDQSLFDKNALKLEKNTIEWVTPAFQGSIQNMSLEQDNANGKNHNIFATITFTHPVDKASLANNIQLLDPANAQTIPYELTYEPDFKTVYLRSSIIAITDKEHYLKLIVGKGVRTTLGKASLKEPQETQQLIPDIYSFLKLENADYAIVENKNGDPQQIFHIALSDAIAYEEFVSHIKITATKSKDGKELAFDPNIEILPISGASSKDFFLKSEIPIQGQVSVKLKKGMMSVNGFKLRRDVQERREIPAYPIALKIMGEGSLLALSGEKQLSFAVRGLSGLKVTVQKLQDDQINHLISQTSGDITSPIFNSYTFNADNITDQQLEEVISLAKTHPKDQNYASLDLSKYLHNQGSGIFFVRVEDYNIKKKRSDYNLEDKRFIIVTDMGIVVKKAADGSRDIFVESISSGKPVSQANVSVIGKNGQPIQSALTSSSGTISVLNLDNYTRAQEPTVIVAKKGNDLAFIPYQEFDRAINYSQFDVGGVHSYDGDKEHELSAYAFSDRGIYRPGENVHLAAIVRQGNFKLENGTVVRAKVNDSRNKLIYKKDFSLDKSGFFEVDLPTSLLNPTGQYTFNIYLPIKTSSGYEQENFLGTASFSIEEFQPDTMKIKARFNPYNTEGWVSIKDLKTEVKLTNLFGLPAQNRKIRASATITPTQFYFAKFSSYTFMMPLFDEKVRRQETIDFNDMQSDSNGSASFDVALPYDTGAFRVDFKAEGFEPDGGRSVWAEASTRVCDTDLMLGFKADGDLSYLKKDQDRSIEFIAVDSKLNPMDLNDLKLELIYNERVSVLTKQRDGRYQYETVIKKKNRLRQPLMVSAQGTSVKLDTHEGGDFTLNVSNSDGRLLSSINYYVATKSNLTGALEKNAVLKLKLDKKTYQPGETIEANIVAPYIGSGLITIESDKVHAHQWFSTSTKSSIQKITLPQDLEGNAYVNVTFVRSMASKEIFTSPLSYAVVPFEINSDKRRVHIDLNVSQRVKPGENLTIQYKTDKQAKIVVFAVDEGILQVAKYTLPDPLKHFLKKRALNVQTYQMLDLILPEFSRYVEAAGIGGGVMAMKSALGANLNPFQRTLDKPAVYWSGIVDANTDVRELNFRVPDSFSGSLKVMAVAVSDDAMGSAEAKTIVRGPFVLSPNVLNMAAPNDEFQVTVGVSNAMEGSEKNAQVDISIQLSDNLTLLSHNKVTKTIAQGDEDKASFSIKALDALGEGKITFTARSGNVFQTRNATLSIRPAQNYATTIKAGYQKEHAVVIGADRILYKSLGSKTLSASNSPFVLASGLSDYLASYPHGCTEQIISQTFPWVALSKSSKFEDTPIDTKVDAVLQMLRARQLGDGGFALWPSSSETNIFASLYAMHFLTELKSISMIDNTSKNLYDGGMDYLRSIARKKSASIEEARQKALAIYLLIRNSEVATNYLIDLHNELQKSGNDWKKDITSTYMAASYTLLKKEKAAKELIKAFDPSYATGYTDFQSNLTMNAQYIYLITTHFPKMELNVNDNILPLLKSVMEGKLNTISASYTILALSAYSQKNEQKYGNDALEFFVVGKQKIALPKSALKPFMTANVPLSEPEVAIESATPLFYQLVESGYDKTPHTKALAQGIEIFKEYVDKNGSIVNEIQQGDEVEVRIKVRTTKQAFLSNVVLIDLLPGGFEVIRESVPRENGSWVSDYVDVREDRVVFYASFSNNMTELRYKVKATAAGTFVVPSASATSMYDPDIFSYTAASKIKVMAADRI